MGVIGTIGKVFRKGADELAAKGDDLAQGRTPAAKNSTDFDPARVNPEDYVDPNASKYRNTSGPGSWLNDSETTAAKHIRNAVGIGAGGATVWAVTDWDAARRRDERAEQILSDDSLTYEEKMELLAELNGEGGGSGSMADRIKGALGIEQMDQTMKMLVGAFFVLLFIRVLR